MTARATTAIEAHEHEIAPTTRENAELKNKLVKLETALAELRFDARASGGTLEANMVRVN
jgi:ribosomal protein L29